jgi:hypothetical protein
MAEHDGHIERHLAVAALCVDIGASRQQLFL